MCGWGSLIMMCLRQRSVLFWARDPAERARIVAFRRERQERGQRERARSISSQQLAG